MRTTYKLITAICILIATTECYATLSNGSLVWMRHPVGYRAQLHPRANTVLTFGYHSLTTYNIASGALIRNYYSGNNVLLSASWSPDGQVIAASFDDHIIRFYNTTTGAVQETLSVSAQPAYDIAWNKAGGMMSITTADSIYFYNLETRQVVRSFFTNGISAVQWHPQTSGQCAIVTFNLSQFTARAMWYDVTSGTVLSSFSDSSVVNAQWSPDGKHVAGLDMNGNINVWELANERLVTHIEPANRQPNDIANMCWQSNTVVLYSSGNLVRSYSIPSGGLHLFATTRPYPVASVAVNLQTNNIVFTSLDDIVEAASQTLQPIQGKVLRGHGDNVSGVLFTGMSTGISFGTHSLQKYSADPSGTVLKTFSTNGSPAAWLCKSLTNDLIATSSGHIDDANTYTVIYNSSTYQYLYELPGRIAAFHPNGNAFVTFDNDKKFRTYNTSTFTITDSAQFNEQLVAMRYDPTGKFIIARTDDGRTILIDDKFEKSHTISQLVDDRCINQLEYQPTEDAVVVLHYNRKIVQGYSTMTEGAVKYTIEFDNQAPTAIASQQQSPITAVGMENGSIYFYNTRTGQLIGEVSFPYPVQCLSWNANGTQLLVGGTGGAVAKYTIGTTSSVENETIDALSVHPNPVNDMLMIHDSEITESTRYTVRNILGQIIQSGSFERGMAISTASWSSGTYYVSAGKKHAVIVKQ